MKFMMIVKHAELSGPPPPALIEAIGRLSQEAAKDGTMIGSGGLLGTATGARVQLSGGKIKVVDGPFTESKENKPSSRRSNSWSSTRNIGRSGKARPRFEK
jgi:hypothetical protein